MGGWWDICNLNIITYCSGPGFHRIGQIRELCLRAVNDSQGKVLTRGN